MTRLFLRWYSASATWWQFWLPQSGLTGGIIGGWFLTALILIGAYLEFG